MMEIHPKEVTCVIMHRVSDTDKGQITNILKLYSCTDVEQMMVYKLSKNHPDKTVIKTKMYPDLYTGARELIERDYPGLCMFNPPMAV